MLTDDGRVMQYKPVSTVDCWAMYDVVFKSFWNFKTGEWQDKVDADCVKKTQAQVESAFTGYRSDDIKVVPWSSNMLRMRGESNDTLGTD